MSVALPTSRSARTKGPSSRRAGRVRPPRRRASSSGSPRTATVVSLIIAVLWTIPTFGLFLWSFRPAELIRTTGWWTFFQNPGLTLDNYQAVLFSTS